MLRKVQQRRLYSTKNRFRIPETFRAMMVSVGSSSSTRVSSSSRTNANEVLESSRNQSPSTERSIVRTGVLFSRSVRSSFASFTLAPLDLPSNTTASEEGNIQEKAPFLVRLQFMDNVQELRSYCRKNFKIGDQIDFLYTMNGHWDRLAASKIDVSNSLSNLRRNELQNAERSWSEQPRWIVDLYSTSDMLSSVIVRESRLWSMKDCQSYQSRFVPTKKMQVQQERQSSNRKRESKDHNQSESWETRGKQVSPSYYNNDTILRTNHHGSGKEKRLQAHELVRFFMKVIQSEVSSSELVGSDEVSMNPAAPYEIEQRVRDWLNRGDGVLDVAGGCGHVSMALGMNGIMSTVVDARSTVGKLPGRDRKVWKRSLKRDSNQYLLQEPSKRNDSFMKGFEYCQHVAPAPTVVPFKSQQAWFGAKPDGYDVSFRHPNEEDIPVLLASAVPKSYVPNRVEIYDTVKQIPPQCGQSAESYVCETSNSSSSQLTLQRQVSALIALHPDEATGEIVQQAVKHRIPFIVVPCCVFARLFPERRTKNGQAVSSYEDLLDFLQEQDPSIHRTELSFGGKNIAIWSMFPDG